MSLTKKDPSLRVAANDPHLVSLGGGRLSTAVTIHYIPIGDTTIGSSTTCSISLNGTGVRPTHCTIYRSEANELTIVPEQDARILIDGTKIAHETNLTQGAMITIGNSNYLRFNNPAEAQMIRSAMGSNERISMPQIDFTQVPQRNSAKSNSTGSSINGGSGSGDGGGGCGGGGGGADNTLRHSMDVDAFFETKIHPDNCSQAEQLAMHDGDAKKTCDYNNFIPIDINGLHCPKVFTADLVTVNMPAKDVLGQKYANFAKNLAENHRNEKNVNNTLRNNQFSVKTSLAMNPNSNPNQNQNQNQSPNQNHNPNQNGTGSAAGNYVNIPSTSNFIQNTSGHSTRVDSTEYLAKVNNTTPIRGNNASNHLNATAYDRYPKPGTYGGLQIYPMNGVNTDINNGSMHASPQHPSSQVFRRSQYFETGASVQKHNLSQLSSSENERLEDMLKICTEYADRQNQSCNSITSSPIVQNRIKTNGSLPRDKKSPFYHELSGSPLQQTHNISGSNGNLAPKFHNGTPHAGASTSSGYENVRLVGQNRVEINGQLASTSGPKTGYENVAVVGKYVPQSPRTKIRTTCMSPKKEHSFGNAFGQAPPPVVQPKPTKQSEYEHLIKTFEEKLKLEMQAIEESSRYQPNAAARTLTTSASAEQTPVKRTNKNINNLTLNLQQSSSLQNSPKPQKKPAPAPRTLTKGNSDSSSSLQRVVASGKDIAMSSLKNGHSDVEQLRAARKELLSHIQQLKSEITELQKQETEARRELDLENALVSAELTSVGVSVEELKHKLQALLEKAHRSEAQRNARRVMEENQQAKLKQKIEIKQEEVKNLEAMLQHKPNDECLKEELHKVCEALENDRRTFEDLEYLYLEAEAEWHLKREELHVEEKELKTQIEQQRHDIQQLEKQELNNQNHATTDVKTLTNNLLLLQHELSKCQNQLRSIEAGICNATGQLHINSSDEDDTFNEKLISSNINAPQSSISNLVSGVMSQSLFGSAELLCSKRPHDDIMSKSVNENMFYNNKLELPSTSTPKRPQMHVVDFNDADLVNTTANSNTILLEQDDPLLRLKYNVAASDEGALSERVKFNLTLGSDDFEVNPLERRAPSQDDIDRICKLTSDTPISTKGATSKIFDSIKEIERNRQLLLAQQGHHVIEHERQKMFDLKKKSHDEARAQYLSMLNGRAVDGNNVAATNAQQRQQQQQQQQQLQNFQHVELQKLETTATEQNEHLSKDKENEPLNANSLNGSNRTVQLNDSKPGDSSQQRLSQPEFESQTYHSTRNSPRPLSEANSELSCDLLSDGQICKSNAELSTGPQSAMGNLSGDDTATKRSSINSNETTSGGSGSASGGSHTERKRTVPKHQRPLTRYLPIFSPDLNLRHHIETAGHQIALCPHVYVDAYSCRGYLHKLGATFHGWARRWFVLDRQKSAFIYYADKSERKPRGGAYFLTIDEVYLDHLNASKSGRPHCTFIVKTKKRSYHLQAASDAAARIWIDAIITGAQGNLDY